MLLLKAEQKMAMQARHFPLLKLQFKLSKEDSVETLYLLTQMGYGFNLSFQLYYSKIPVKKGLTTF